MARVRDMQGVPAQLEVLKSDGHRRHPSHCIFHTGKGANRICTNPQGPLYYQQCTTSKKGVSPIYAITAYSISEEKADEALQILYVLLDHDVVIDGDMALFGRTLLNTDTNQKIKDALLQRNPELSSKITSAPSGGCYIATAVYGLYDCPQVWTLRRYRDYALAETWYGRAFIRIYYTVSPALVKWFGHAEWFKKLWKEKLDRMVANLNAEGVEDTPYEDRMW